MCVVSRSVPTAGYPAREHGVQQVMSRSERGAPLTGARSNIVLQAYVRNVGMPSDSRDDGNVVLRLRGAMLYEV